MDSFFAPQFLLILDKSEFEDLGSRSQGNLIANQPFLNCLPACLRYYSGKILEANLNCHSISPAYLFRGRPQKIIQNTNQDYLGSLDLRDVAILQIALIYHSFPISIKTEQTQQGNIRALKCLLKNSKFHLDSQAKIARVKSLLAKKSKILKLDSICYQSHDPDNKTQISISSPVGIAIFRVLVTCLTCFFFRGTIISISGWIAPNYQPSLIINSQVQSIYSRIVGQSSLQTKVPKTDMSETTLCQIDLGALFKFKIKFGGVIDFNNKLNKFMNGSPFRTFDSSSQHFVTPSRKTTPHHCNADKKIMPVCSIELTDLSGLSRNLFGEDLSNRPANNYLNINAKLFR